MKKLLAVILLAALCISGCANENGNIPEGMKKADNDAVDYWFYYPDNWEQDRNDGIISIRCNTTQSSAASRYISISVMCFGLADTSWGVVQYWEDYRAKVSDMYKDYTLTGESELSLGGTVAASKKYTATVGTQACVFEQVFCVRNGVVYIVTLTTDNDNFALGKEALDKVCGSFSFK